jgi:SnoaL-like domain
MASRFAPHIRVYFLHQPPIEGREVLARYWREFQAATRAHWTVDRVLTVGSEAVLEYSMLWTPPAPDKEVLMRGIDWLSCVQEQIEEIRQYYDVRGLVSDDEPYELQGFPYGERGYPTLTSMSRL